MKVTLQLYQIIMEKFNIILNEIWVTSNWYRYIVLLIQNKTIYDFSSEIRKGGISSSFSTKSSVHSLENQLSRRSILIFIPSVPENFIFFLEMEEPVDVAHRCAYRKETPVVRSM